MSDREFRTKFFELVGAANSIAIVSHLAPDEDSVGAVLAMHELLRGRTLEISKGPTSRILYTGNRLARFEALTGYEQVEFVPDIADELSNVDLIIFLDANGWHRASLKPEKMRGLGARVLCLDHHRTNEKERFDLVLIDPDCPSTSELIYRIFYHDEMPSQMATQALLMGILGDTGNFAYLAPNHTATFDIVKNLLPVAGVSIQEFQSRYRGLEPKTLAGIRCLLENMELHQLPNWPPFQTTFLTQEFVSPNNPNDEEISEITHGYIGHFLTGIKGHHWGLILSPRSSGGVRVSMRSRTPQTNVRRILERLVKAGILESGGGHDQAGGGTFSKGEPKTCLKQILEWLEQNQAEN